MYRIDVVVALIVEPMHALELQVIFVCNEEA
jgi:hypothetical protein